MEVRRNRDRMKPVRIILLSLLIVVIAGTGLLMCPFCSASGQATGFVDALFTATSATCVTGLTVFDTASYWSTAGKCVILLLIQIGGLGAMTLITSLTLLIRRKMTLHDSQILMQSAGNDQRGGLRKLVRRLFIGTIIFESAGAAALATRFVPMFGWGKGICYGIFHSVSAFCNAGFDIMGDYGGVYSLTYFVGDPVVNITVMALIVIGGLGFVVWDDLLNTRFRFRELRFHSKLVLLVTGILLLGGGVLFFFMEGDYAFRGLTTGERVWAAMFQSVTPRTAGFFTVQMSELSEPGALLTIILMFIGGSPGSTAGGVKTTTLAVVFLSAAAAVARSEPSAFRRRIDGVTVRQAVSIFTIYLTGTLVATMIICALEQVTIRDSLFEVVSAIATVGLSTGITATLCGSSKVLLSLLMFMGRIGGLSMFLAISANQTQNPVKKPVGRVQVG